MKAASESRGYLLGNESIQSCADAAPYCGSFTKMPEFAVDGGNLFLAPASFDSVVDICWPYDSLVDMQSPHFACFCRILHWSRSLQSARFPGRTIWFMSFYEHHGNHGIQSSHFRSWLIWIHNSQIQSVSDMSSLKQFLGICQYDLPTWLDSIRKKTLVAHIDLSDKNEETRSENRWQTNPERTIK